MEPEIAPSVIAILRIFLGEDLQPFFLLKFRGGGGAEEIYREHVRYFPKIVKKMKVEFSAKIAYILKLQQHCDVILQNCLSKTTRPLCCLKLFAQGLKPSKCEI